MAYLKNQWSVLLCLVIIVSFTNPMQVTASQDEIMLTGGYRATPVSKADFYEFWQAALTQLAQWPAQVRRNAAGDELQFQSQAGRVCTAAYCVPANCTVTGAILHIAEKGNLKRHLSWHDGYAHLGINWYPPDENRQWQPQGLPDRQAYILVEAVVHAARAVEVLLSQRQILADRVGISGEGVGGAIAIALASLMPERVAFVIAYEPWPAYHYPPSRLMPQSSPVASALAAHEAQYPQWRQVMRRSARDADIINFAPQVEAPTLIVAPQPAPHSPPTPAVIIYNHLRCEKQLLYTPPARDRRPYDQQSYSKELCHQWTQQALASARHPQATLAGAFDELLIPESVPVAALPGEDQQFFVPTASVRLSR